MKPHLLNKITTAILLASCVAPMVSAETLNFGVTGQTDSALQPNPLPQSVSPTVNDSLFSQTVFAGNVVNVGGGTIGGYVFGGVNPNGTPNVPENVTNNTVNISGGTIGTAATAAAAATGDVFGGWTNVGNSTNNNVNITGGTINGRVIGGLTNEGNVANNTVTVTPSAATTLSTVIGGWANSAGNMATGNRVELGANTTVSFTGTTPAPGATPTPGRVVGGWSVGDSSGNGVSIDGANVNILLSPATAGGVVAGTDRIVGGYSQQGNSTNNTLSITGTGNTVSLLAGTAGSAVGDPLAPIAGGWGRVSANQNTLTIGGTSTVEGFSAGGASDADAIGNAVIITGGILTTTDRATPTTTDIDLTALAGGFNNGQFTERLTTSVVSDNTVNISGTANITGKVHGGLSLGATTVTNNTLTINMTTGGIITGDLYGGTLEIASMPSSTIQGVTVGSNTIDFQAGNVNGIAFGGKILNTVGGHISDSVISSNTVGINSGATVGDVYGGFYKSAGTATNLSITGNTVMIHNGATVNGNAYGGAYESTGASENISITNNTVMIHSGATIGTTAAPLNVYGGFYTSGGTSANVSITDNTVYLADASTVNGDIYGGFASNIPGANISNNTLVVAGRVNVNGAINNFDNYDFRLTKAMINGTPILNTTTAVNLAGANISLSSMGGDGPLVTQGQSLTLFNNTTGLTPGQMIAVRGITFLDTYSLTAGANGVLTATLDQTALNAQANNVTSGHTAAVTGAMAGNSFVSDQGMDAFLNSATTAGKWVPFIAAGVGRDDYDGQRLEIRINDLRTDRSSHDLRIDKRMGVLGIGTAMPLADGIWHVAAFAETNHQSYETHSGGIFGSGNTTQSGGGLMTRLTWNNGVYGELVLRTGSSKYDYRSNGFGNLDASYDLRGNYRGVTAAVGMMHDFADHIALDSYLQYLYARQDGDTAIVAGDRVEFGTASISSALIGFDLTYNTNDRWTPYASVKMEYTFNSDHRNTAQGINLEAVDIEGSTGSGGVGVRFTPASNWMIDANVSGNIGIRDGYQANVGLSYAF